jgi:hypothetical protein
MSRIVCFSCLVLLTAFLGACVAPPATSPTAAPTAPSTAAMINPGDKIADFLVTTGKTGEVIYQWDLGCTKQGSAEVYICKTTVGKQVNLSVGVYADHGKTLDSLWSEHTYELFVGDRPVNLTAFGSIDIQHPRVGTMRCWNVVLEAAKPGEIAVRDRGKVGDEAFESTTTFTFSAP